MLANHRGAGKAIRQDGAHAHRCVVARVAQVVAPARSQVEPATATDVEAPARPDAATQVPVPAPAPFSSVDDVNTPRIGLNLVSQDGVVDSHVIMESGPSPNRATVLRNIVFISSEVAPWSKTGGLGDVMGSLPKALAARGHRVLVVAPRYANYPEAIDTGKRHLVMGSEVGYFHHVSNGVDYVFVDHPSFPRPGGIYSDSFGAYGDNDYRFALLTVAALEVPLVLPLGEQGLYGQECVFMANDWHTSLVPVYLAAKYRAYGVYKGSRSILAIHNLKHQGVFPPRSFAQLDLPGDWYKALEWQYPPHQRQGSYEEEGRALNYMKAGISCADRVVTVSPGYADEIKSWMGGWGMDGLITSREFVLNGITNGIDTNDWNPEVDKHLVANYDEKTFVEGKIACKKAMQTELSLPVDQEIPLVAFIGRLDNQKGADILLEAAKQMLPQGRFQLVCLGTGDKDLEDGLKWLEATYREKARCWVGFNVPFSHRLTAAADIVLMPSRFEPCGLNQLYAMRYGAVPVAHKTGGLKDTVIDFNPFVNPPQGTGWTYTTCDPDGLVWALGLALKTYYEHRADFRAMQLRGMQRDSSWDTAAQQYEQCMNWAMMDQPWCK